MKILDLKAIGYGLVTFVAGHMLVWLLGQTILTQVFSRITLTTPPGIVTIVGVVGDIIFIAPAVIAGFISACKAHSHHIINGTIGGVLAVVLLMVFFFPFINGILGWGPAFLILTAHVVAALIGAALGSYWHRKRITRQALK